MALLALLAARADDGFDAMRHFDASVGYLWHVSHTQSYAELRKWSSRAWSRPPCAASGQARA
ncbi:hypothetical protein GCM10010182_82100 [Actinomadura cremea]|nr:hypothetical protein GCM10010182_82100 [Actinomadura cremea]